MQISKKVYIDEAMLYHKWAIWKLRKNKKVKNVYCICIAHEKKYLLEIIKGTHVTSKHSKNVLIGIAKTKQQAINLIVQIFDEVYVPNPNIQHMKEYFVLQ